MSFGDDPAGIPPPPSYIYNVNQDGPQSGGLPTVSVIFRRGGFLLLYNFYKRGRCEEVGERMKNALWWGWGVWVSTKHIAPTPEKIYHKTNLLPCLYRLIPAHYLPLGDFPFLLSFPPWYILFLLMVGFVFLA